MNEQPRQTDMRKLQPKYISNFDAVHSQEIGYLFNKIKKTVPRKYEQPPEELPEREREIRMAIEMRFNRSKMNKDYVYRL
jgi:hypothetical protein